MTNLGFEVILFGTIIFVILFDLIKGKKNESEEVSQYKLMKSTRNNVNIEGKNTSPSLKYMAERPRNIGIFLVSVILVKIIINSLIFKNYWFEGSIVSEEPDFWGDEFGRNGEFFFKDYVRYAFEINLSSFVYALIVVSFIAWQLNPYIKKR